MSDGGDESSSICHLLMGWGFARVPCTPAALLLRPVPPTFGWKEWVGRAGEGMSAMCLRPGWVGVAGDLLPAAGEPGGGDWLPEGGGVMGRGASGGDTCGEGEREGPAPSAICIWSESQPPNPSKGFVGTGASASGIICPVCQPAHPANGFTRPARQPHDFTQPAPRGIHQMCKAGTQSRAKGLDCLLQPHCTALPANMMWPVGKAWLYSNSRMKYRMVRVRLRKLEVFHASTERDANQTALFAQPSQGWKS